MKKAQQLKQVLITLRILQEQLEAMLAEEAGEEIALTARGRECPVSVFKHGSYRERVFDAIKENREPMTLMELAHECAPVIARLGTVEGIVRYLRMRGLVT